MTGAGIGSKRRLLGVCVLLACLALAAVDPLGRGGGSPAFAAAQTTDKPYDDRLVRLSEILGAVHYLRELCGSNDGQAWRLRMRELIEAEGSAPLRRAKLARSFNRGYQSYNRTYKTCTTTARTAIKRFIIEGIQIAEALVETIR